MSTVQYSTVQRQSRWGGRIPLIRVQADPDGNPAAWYIPPEWITGNETSPTNIIEAARLASKFAEKEKGRQISYSGIPLIVHQTWKTSRIDDWDNDVLFCVERWLQHATDSPTPMAYMFWNDGGIMAFIENLEKELAEDFKNMFSPVERTDIFRVLVVKHFGGIVRNICSHSCSSTLLTALTQYGDVDTEPLKHPVDWVGKNDIATWIDPETKKEFRPDSTAAYEGRPVSIIWGLEADTDPASDDYWRMGYTYPVQLTQWALASAPHHAVLDKFVSNLKLQIQNEKGVDGWAAGADPLTRTGPAAVTKATKDWLEKQAKLTWNSLTGLKDGGKAKLVLDVLILPITGFSPGRGRYGNMGSKPVTDPDARLMHHAKGSWRHFDLKVEVGKFCRTFFGMCKDWSKVPT